MARQQFEVQITGPVQKTPHRNAGTGRVTNTIMEHLRTAGYTIKSMGGQGDTEKSKLYMLVEREE